MRVADTVIAFMRYWLKVIAAVLSSLSGVHLRRKRG